MPYSEDIEHNSEDIEKGIEEGPAGHASEVLGEESLEGSSALGAPIAIIVEVPLHSITGNDVVNCIYACLHASLRNWMPQMNSIALSTCRKTFW